MEITAKLFRVDEPSSFGENGFMVQEFYLDATRFDQYTGAEYKNHLKFQNLNEKLDLKSFSIGDVVKVTFFPQGKFGTNKETGNDYFIQNMNAFKIELVKRGETLNSNENTNVHSGVKPHDDLPF